MRENIKLIRPTADYAQDIMAFRQESLENNPEESMGGAGSLPDCHNAQDWIESVENMRMRETCPAHLVDSDIYGEYEAVLDSFIKFNAILSCFATFGLCLKFFLPIHFTGQWSVTE